MNGVKSLGILFSVAVMLLTVATVGALEVNTDTLFVSVTRNSIRPEQDVSTTFLGEKVLTSGKSQNGFACPGREAGTNNPVLRNNWTSGNWSYRVLIKEPSVDAWPAGRIYRVELFGDGNRITQLYFRNNNANATQIEGVNLRADVGSANSKPDSYTTIINRLDQCP